MHKNIALSALHIFIIGSNVLFKGSQTEPDLSETSPQMISVIPGEDALIDCVARNSDNLTLLWKFTRNLRSPDQKLLSANNIILSDDKRYSVLHNKDKNLWILRVKRAEISDTGLYTCELNSKPAVSVTRIVVVEYPKSDNILLNQTKSFADKVNHNFTDCCVKEGVPPICYGYCEFKGLVSDRPKAHIFAICINYMQQLTKCLTDGRDHVPCCQRQNVPRVCHPSCAGRYTLTTALEHVTCVEYSGATLACIAEGIETLPPPPREVTAQAISSSQVIVKWENNANKSHALIDTYQLNITELHSFDPIEWKLKPKKESKKDFISNNSPPNTKSLNITANSTEFTINDLRHSTMYEIVMISINQMGTSVATNGLRVVTLSPDTGAKKPIIVITDKTIDSSSVPNLRKCCLDNGVKSELCLDALCDPIKVEDASPNDISQCIQYANVTFNCLATDIDNRDCCSERGVSQFCVHFCKEKNPALDFRHIICLHHIPAYSSCYLETKGVLSSEPLSVSVSSAQSTWALFKWSPPTKLAETVIKYRVHIRELDADTEDGYLIDTVHRSPYLIESLRPDQSYEVYVSALNKHGPSRGSTRVIFKTSAVEDNEDIELEQSYASTGYNETACCERAQIPDTCLPLCNYHFKISDALNLGPLCADHRTLRVTLRCLAGGRDHRACCERRGIEPNCLELCTGMITDSPYIIAAKCSKFSGKMLQCMAEGSDTLPGMPEDLHATLVTQTSVQLRWNASAEDLRSGLHVSYQLSYSKIDTEIPPHPYEDKYSIKINITDTQTTLSDLKPDTRYSIYMAAFNEYGFSLPSLVLVITTKSESDISKSRGGIIRASLGAPHSIEVFHETTESLSVKWLPPYYMPPDASLMYEVKWKLFDNTSISDATKQNWTTIETHSTLMDITGLRYNTQYAIAVMAKTVSTDLKSPLSEIVIASTEAATPLLISPPKLEPIGPIIEGSMMVVRCDATGSPLPTITLFVNGVPAHKEQTRHLRFRLDYVQRNLTSLSCLAANAETDSSPEANPAQSHIEVRVRYAPTLRIDRRYNVAVRYGSAQLRCEVGGNPPPKVQFFRDLRNQAEIRNGPNTQITLFPHSTKASTWIATLIISQVTESDAGSYLCVAQNEYGRETSLLTLKVENYQTTNRNSSACCVEQKVSNECQRACKFEIDFDFVFNKPQCFGELDKYMFCAADGSDHRECCVRRDVTRDCIHWCAGYKVSKPSLCLLSSVRDIVSCFREGNALLPSPPVNVRVSQMFDDYRAIISWDKPEKNSDAVQWYSVYWKQVGSKDLESDRTDKLEYELHDISPEQVYEFLVKSSNYYGTSALTEPLVIDSKSIRLELESGGDLMLKILLLSLLTIVIMVIIAVIGYYAFKRKDAILSKFRSQSTGDSGYGVSFENLGYVNNADSVPMQDRINNNNNNNSVPNAESSATTTRHSSSNSSGNNNNSNSRPIVEIRMN